MTDLEGSGGRGGEGGQRSIDYPQFGLVFQLSVFKFLKSAYKSQATILGLPKFRLVFSSVSSLSIRPSLGARGEEIIGGGEGRGRRERKA